MKITIELFPAGLGQANPAIKLDVEALRELSKSESAIIKKAVDSLLETYTSKSPLSL